MILRTSRVWLRSVACIFALLLSSRSPGIEARDAEQLFVDATCTHNTLNSPLPVRYVFVQLTGPDGEHLGAEDLRDPAQELIEVVVKRDMDSNCKFRHELLNNFDGTYTFRLKLFFACSRIEVEFWQKHKDADSRPLCGGPIIVDNPAFLQPDDCFCEERPSAQVFFNRHCDRNPRTYRQLTTDMAQFREINFDKTLEKVENRWGHPNQARSAALCRYSIDNSEVKKHCYGEYTGFSTFSDDILTSLARKMRLPKMEYIQNLGDWPLERDNPMDASGVPVVSWCGSNTTFDIVLPTYELTESVIKSMDSVTRDIHNALGDKFVPWEKKLNKTVFRGRDSNKLRIDAAKLANAKPNLLDGGITRYFFFHDESNPHPVTQEPFPDFFRYKFVLNIDGTVAAYRFPFLLAGDSVVLKQESEYYEHFYGLLKPGKHFIAFDDNNMETVLKSVQKSENLQKIAKAARKFTREHLQPLDVICYHVKFLLEYAAKYKRPQSARFQNTSWVNVPLGTLDRSQQSLFCNCPKKTSFTPKKEL